MPREVKFQTARPTAAEDAGFVAGRPTQFAMGRVDRISQIISAAGQTVDKTLNINNRKNAQARALERQQASDARIAANEQRRVDADQREANTRALRDEYEQALIAREAGDDSLLFAFTEANRNREDITDTFATQLSRDFVDVRGSRGQESLTATKTELKASGLNAAAILQPTDYLSAIDQWSEANPDKELDMIAIAEQLWQQISEDPAGILDVDEAASYNAKGVGMVLDAMAKARAGHLKQQRDDQLADARLSASNNTVADILSGRVDLDNLNGLRDITRDMPEATRASYLNRNVFGPLSQWAGKTPQGLDDYTQTVAAAVDVGLLTAGQGMEYMQDAIDERQKVIGSAETFGYRTGTPISRATISSGETPLAAVMDTENPYALATVMTDFVQSQTERQDLTKFIPDSVVSGLKTGKPTPFDAGFMASVVGQATGTSHADPSNINALYKQGSVSSLTQVLGYVAGMSDGQWYGNLDGSSNPMAFAVRGNRVTDFLNEVDPEVRAFVLLATQHGIATDATGLDIPTSIEQTQARARELTTRLKETNNILSSQDGRNRVRLLGEMNGLDNLRAVMAAQTIAPDVEFPDFLKNLESYRSDMAALGINIRRAVSLESSFRGDTTIFDVDYDPRLLAPEHTFGDVGIDKILNSDANPAMLRDWGIDFSSSTVSYRDAITEQALNQLDVAVVDNIDRAVTSIVPMRESMNDGVLRFSVTLRDKTGNHFYHIVETDKAMSKAVKNDYRAARAQDEVAELKRLGVVSDLSPEADSGFVGPPRPEAVLSAEDEIERSRLLMERLRQSDDVEQGRGLFNLIP